MEEAIRKKLAELGDKQPEEVRVRGTVIWFQLLEVRLSLSLSLQLFELQIEGVQSTKVEGLSEKFQALASLSFVNCGLNTLEGLPKLPALTTVRCQRRIERQNRRAWQVPVETLLLSFFFSVKVRWNFNRNTFLFCISFWRVFSHH